MAFRPEKAFRIADSRHKIFDGTGAFLNGARWNSPGRRIIYASESFAGAMLETLARARIGRIPRTHAWVEVGIPADVSIEILDRWDVPQRTFGDEWHDQGRSLILMVPSAIAVGQIRNILINQDHAEFSRLRASEPEPVVWDERLFGR
jgi:RES domain-containing protein